jgi:hypothetical protein
MLVAKYTMNCRQLTEVSSSTNEELVHLSVKVVNVNLTFNLVYSHTPGTQSQNFKELLPFEILGVATQDFRELLRILIIVTVEIFLQHYKRTMMASHYNNSVGILLATVKIKHW